ncbi:SDR family NAD(P)-dependent oxidoreductase [Herbiconiux sp. A18JL235]|uniref:SDR family NAD(P)-dependent oxidoreductase n=1 Tax=Herbiconiux sp. A18JL235 TaxID=3152363 RepID=A0AB39BH22_9MICO
MPEITPHLSGRTVLVTGAGGGAVGSGICDALDRAGARLVVNDVDADAARQAASRYDGAFAVEGDISTATDAARIVATAVERSGSIDALVNNAGVNFGTAAHLASEEVFDRLYAVDVKGLWLMSRSFAQHRIALGGGGSILNISSIHAARTQNGFALYAGAKAAVEGLTRGFAVELGRYRIRCNGLAPGAVLDEAKAHDYGVGDDPVGWVREHTRTRQVIDRAVLPVDIGEVAAFLVSDQAWAVAGQTITVDAGLGLLLYDRAFTGDV